MITKEEIISKVKELVIKNKYVYALWLEGSDGLGVSDAYSDIDFWFDIEDDKMYSVMEKLIKDLKLFSETDVCIKYGEVDGLYKAKLHFKQSSPFLFLDINAQKHSRDRKFTKYAKNDIAEFPLVLFDKVGVISYKKTPAVNSKELMKFVGAMEQVFAENIRVTRYIKREKFIEACQEYYLHVINPLIGVVRAVYTPRHYNYETCQISRHLPGPVVAELEELFKIGSLKELSEKVEKAKKMFGLYVRRVKDSVAG